MFDTQRIVAGLEGWLREEVTNSHSGRNAVLDDWRQLREDIVRDIADPENQDSRKYHGHVQRFTILMEAVDDEVLETNDFVAGKAIHHALIFVSGGFRKVCALRAANQTEYEDMRLRGECPVNVDTGRAIIKAKVGHAEDGESFQSLQKRALFLSGRILRRHDALSEWMQDNPKELFRPQALASRPVELARDIQETGLELAGRLILFAAQSRGALEQVPTLEPKSISDVSRQPIYPFAD